MNNQFLYNNKILRDRRRELRNNQTKAELALWSKLKNSQLEGLKFVRQYSVGPYILDFYCPKLRLAIELDGNQHRKEVSAEYDRFRNKYLKSVDIKTIRFWNDDIINEMEATLQKIKTALNSRSETSSLKVRGE